MTTAPYNIFGNTIPCITIVILSAELSLETIVQRCSVKKVFLGISQNSQENICARVSFLIKLQARPLALLKKRLWQMCFTVNFAKFLRTPFLAEHLCWLFLYRFNYCLIACFNSWIFVSTPNFKKATCFSATCCTKDSLIT